MGEKVYNKQFDANHWNFLGAYYAVNDIILELNKQILTKINAKNEFNISEKLEKSLLVSHFKINEYVPKFELKNNILDLSDEYSDEILIDNQYRTFKYTRNDKKIPKTKVMVFQGSYMNDYGDLFFENAFNKYIAIHDYQNVINFDYYYNIFKPDAVIFELADYTFSNKYFNIEKMKKINYNPEISSVKLEKINRKIADLDIQIENGKSIGSINLDLSKNKIDNKVNNLYLYYNNQIYDMIFDENKNIFITSIDIFNKEKIIQSKIDKICIVLNNNIIEYIK